MIEILILFLGVSLLLYIVLGGADYGAGILELLPAGNLKEQQRKVINHAMGPVWEANHIWLILIVVILFVGFPTLFTTTMIHLHIPLVALLIGIVVRGTAFTFRHYDAIYEQKSQQVYSLLFGLSSLWSAAWLGVIGASLGRGIINSDSRTFWDAYIAPWWGLFPLTMAGFVISIFCFLAGVFLVGETDNNALRILFRRRAFIANVAVVIWGGLVFISATLEGHQLSSQFFSNFQSLSAMATATLLFFALWYFAPRGKAIIMRAIAGAEVGLILLGWYSVVGSSPVHTAQGSLTFYNSAASTATLWQLVLALGVGTALIFPSLFFLLKIFKLNQTDSY